MQRHTIVLVAAGLFVPSMAGAHVTVQPKQGTVKSFQEYVVRVPTEKDAPTTAVRMVFPEGFDVLRFRRTPGWRYEIERDASGRIASVTWSGGSISREEYELFSFMARAAAPGTYKLDAYQTYGANDVVAWVNPAEPRPAPQITIVAGGGQASNSADPFADGASRSSAAAGTSASASAKPLERSIMGASLVVALAALLMSGRALRRPRA